MTGPSRARLTARAGLPRVADYSVIRLRWITL